MTALRSNAPHGPATLPGFGDPTAAHRVRPGGEFEIPGFDAMAARRNVPARNGIKDEAPVRKQIAESSRQLVASAFIVPILSEFRESTAKGGPFGRSQAEDRLGPIFDAHVADSIIERGKLDLTARVEEQMLARAGLAPRPTWKPGEPLSKTPVEARRRLEVTA